MSNDPVNQEELKAKLEELMVEHRRLDEEISHLHHTGSGDSLALNRLKREKLHLKDQILLIEDRLLPDIIA